MDSSRAIVGIGEILLLHEPGSVRVAGLAAEVATSAMQLGYHGVAISRIGQDAPGEQAMADLAAVGIDTSHVQSDPDLPTGRLTVRTLAGRTTRLLEAPSAFDNLQWDFDLEDIAQQTEAVIFGELARRNSQSRTTIDRFLASCPHALRVFDLTNRGDGPLDRSVVLRTLQHAEGIVIDAATLAQLAPGSRDEPQDVVVSSLERKYNLAFVLLIGEDSIMHSHAADDRAHSEERLPPDTTAAAITAVLHGLLSGWSWPRALAQAVRFARFVHEHPNDDVPDNLLDAT